MFPSDLLEAHNSRPGSITDPIQPHTQVSSQVLDTPLSLCIGINSGNDGTVKNTSIALGPHPKRQRVQGYSGTETNCGSMHDEDPPTQQTTMGGETTTQPTVQTLLEKAKGSTVGIMQEMGSLMQQTGTLMSTLGPIMGSMPDAKKQEMINTIISIMGTMMDNMRNISTTTTSDVIQAKADDAINRNNNITRQFTIPPLDLPYTVKPATEHCPFPELDIEDKHMMVPSMILCVLANNPRILLPLASFQTSLFDPIHALNKESFRLSCKPMSFFTGLVKATLSVVCNRITSALNRLYPKLNGNDSDEEEAMAQQLEEGPVDVLESIVRDGMAVCNPIRVLITHLEAVITHYSKCTTPKERKALRRYIVKEQYDWMQDITDMAIVYAHYLWDSQWVSDEEWDTLVKYINILTTKIFPKVNSLLMRDSGPRSTLTQDEHNILRYFKFILGIISCCFLYHYRPMQQKTYIPYHHLQDMNTHFHPISRSIYETALASAMKLFKQCVVECIDHPTAFPHFSSMENLLKPNSKRDHDEYSRQNIMSIIDKLWDSDASRVYFPNNEPTHGNWMSLVPMYYGQFSLNPVYIINRIIHAPPQENPVYQRIAGIYPKKVNRVTLIGFYYSLVGRDPQLQKAPVKSAPPNSDPRSSVEEA